MTEITAALVVQQLHRVVNTYLSDAEPPDASCDEDPITTGCIVAEPLLDQPAVLDALNALMLRSYGSPAPGVPALEERSRPRTQSHCWRLHRAIDTVGDALSESELAELAVALEALDHGSAARHAEQ